MLSFFTLGCLFLPRLQAEPESSQDDVPEPGSARLPVFPRPALLTPTRLARGVLLRTVGGDSARSRRHHGAHSLARMIYCSSRGHSIILGWPGRLVLCRFGSRRPGGGLCTGARQGNDPNERGECSREWKHGNDCGDLFVWLPERPLRSVCFPPGRPHPPLPTAH